MNYWYINCIEFFIKKLNKGLLYSLCIGNQDIVNINVCKIVQTCHIQLLV